MLLKFFFYRKLCQRTVFFCRHEKKRNIVKQTATRLRGKLTFSFLHEFVEKKRESVKHFVQHFQRAVIFTWGQVVTVSVGFLEEVSFRK